MTERPKLGGAFKPPAAPPPDRSEGLAGILAPRTTDASAAAPRTTPEAPPTAPKVPAPAKPAAAPRETVVSGGAVGNVPVYLPDELRQQVQQVTRTRGIRFAELLVECFDNVSDEDLAAEFAPLPPAVAGNTMPSRPRPRRGAPGIQIQVRLDTDQRTWLDHKVKALNAPSRSALVAAVFKLGLKP